MYVVVRAGPAPAGLPVSYFSPCVPRTGRAPALTCWRTPTFTRLYDAGEAVRQELNGFWNRRRYGRERCAWLQVSDMDQHTLQLRALWDRGMERRVDLRCLVARKADRVSAAEFPGSLPRYRGEMETTAKRWLTAGRSSQRNGGQLVAEAPGLRRGLRRSASGLGADLR